MTWNKDNKEYTNEAKYEAYEMVKANKVNEMTMDELNAALAYADDCNFYAEMSDDYNVTRAERAAVYEWAHVVDDERKRRAA